MKIRATFNDQGLPTSFYPEDVWPTDFPSEAIEISYEQYEELILNQGFRKWDGSKVVEYTPPAQEPEPVVTILPAVTLWERLTEDEADQVNEAMSTQPVRTQRIFTTANTFRSDHELWPLLEQMATELFGEARAAELLAG